MKACSLALLLAGSKAFRLHSESANEFNVSVDEAPTEVVVPVANMPNIDEMEPAVLDDETTDVGHPGAAESQKMAFPALETNSQSCLCAKFSLQRYQTWPMSPEGGGCVGWCSGTEFQIQKYGGTMKQITVWTNGNKDSQIRAIRWTWHDGAFAVRGNPERGGGPWSFDFAPGEYVTGDFRLTGAKSKNRVGSIVFSSSRGRKFDVGLSRLYGYLFPSGGAYIGGFSGWSGSEINQLGVIFWKPIRSIQYESLSYPTLSSLARVSSPDKISSRTYCNSLPFPLPNSKEVSTKKYEIGTSTCVETSASIQFSNSITVKGGVPGLAEVSATASWEVGASVTRTNCRNHTTTTTRELTYPELSIPARTSFEYVFSRWSGRLTSLPFRAVLRITLTDGYAFLRAEFGTYEGVSFTDVTEGYGNLREVASCR